MLIQQKFLLNKYRLFYLSVFQKGTVAFFRFVNVDFARYFPWSMHIEHGNAAVDYLHTVKSHDVGNRSAAAQVNAAELGELNGNIVLFHDGADISEIFRIGIVGTGFAACTRKFVERHTAAKISNVFRVKRRFIQCVVSGSYIGREHFGIGKAAVPLNPRRPVS